MDQKSDHLRASLFRDEKSEISNKNKLQEKSFEYNEINYKDFEQNEKLLDSHNYMAKKEIKSEIQYN